MADDDINALRAQIASLTRENQRLIAENTKRKVTNRDLQSKLTTATADLTLAVKDRDTFKTKAETTPGTAGEELESLRTQVRIFRHRDGMAELAYSTDVGLNKSVPIDRLMRLLDYKPVAEEFDAKAVKQVLIALKESDPYLFAESGSNQPSQRNGVQPLNPAVAGLGNAFGRGTLPNANTQELTDEQLRNPEFMSRYNAQQREAMKK